jgi:hypothetical protein
VRRCVAVVGRDVVSPSRASAKRVFAADRGSPCVNRSHSHSEQQSLASRASSRRCSSSHGLLLRWARRFVGGIRSPLDPERGTALSCEGHAVVRRGSNRKGSCRRDRVQGGSEQRALRSRRRWAEHGRCSCVRGDQRGGMRRRGRHARPGGCAVRSASRTPSALRAGRGLRIGCEALAVDRAGDAIQPSRGQKKRGRPRTHRARGCSSQPPSTR